MRWILRLALIVLLAAALVRYGKPAFEAWSFRRQENPIQRGARVAAAAGCFGCHGPGGLRGLKNPGSKWGDVPSWAGGTAMMFLTEPSDLEEYIRFGLPRRKRRNPETLAQVEKAAIVMPAYEGRVSDPEIRDLVRYVAAVSGIDRPKDGPAAQGYDLVQENACFSCHGVDGAGGVRNPGSFKGYIPGWRGSDWGDLVRSDAEIRQWINDGGITRWEGNRLARYFSGRQALRMPAYRKYLSPAQVDQIVAYLAWLRARPSL
ncbi:MAG TPA: c-type cytochrome [Candidatus Polarisedimenticolia bacterium]|nr:c-type cytochrome [Candidatus Polarisedimenticolia bacterium]